MPSTKDPIKILIVEDNLVVQRYLKSALEMDSQNVILDIISDGILAVEKAVTLKPDIILLDLLLPSLDGIEVIQRVMHQAPCPIVVISGELNRKDRDLTFEAQRAGAVDVLPKPVGMEYEHFKEFSDKLCHTIKMMSQIKVTRRWFYQKTRLVAEKTINSESGQGRQQNLVNATEQLCHHQQPSLPVINIYNGVLLIGSSTGGPSALYQILEHIPKRFPFSILIAQHITEGFSETLASWLSKTGCQVCIPKDGELIERGKVYLADDGRHLVLGKNRKLHQVVDSRPRYSPSVDLLFQSVQENFEGSVCAIVLTGMGDDGAVGIEKLYRSGAFTIAEDESSCVIFGMPKMAINTGSVKSVLPLTEICKVIDHAAKS